MPAGAGEVGMLQRATGTVDTGALSVPNAGDAVVIAVRVLVDHLRAHQCGHGLLLVTGREKASPVFGEQRLGLGQLQVITGQRAARVSSNESPGAEAQVMIAPSLLEGKSNEHGHAREIKRAFNGCQSIVYLHRTHPNAGWSLTIVRSPSGLAES